MKTGITHHIPDNLLLSYASGSLPQPFSLVVAAHVSMCDDCRARLGAHQSAGAAVLERNAPVDLSDGMKGQLLDRLDDTVEDEPVHARSGIYPGTVMQALKGAAPRWKPLGRGARQTILSHDREGSARLLFIPPGQAMPDHGHNGLELTLVLQGAFSDSSGRFGPGDVEVAGDEVEHAPVAEDGMPCICLAATDAPLRFRPVMARLVQPFFRI